MRFTMFFEINDDRPAALTLMHNDTNDNRGPLRKRILRKIAIGKIVLLALAVPAGCGVIAMAPTCGTYEDPPLPYGLNPGFQISVGRHGISHGIETPVYPRMPIGDRITTSGPVRRATGQCIGSSNWPNQQLFLHRSGTANPLGDQLDSFAMQHNRK
jgi:hypothetical protein